MKAYFHAFRRTGRSPVFFNFRIKTNCMNRLTYFLLAAGLLIGGCRPEIPLPDDGTAKWRDAAKKPFYHGVASGDPLPDRVIIWTRVTPDVQMSVPVSWKVALDPAMREVVQKGRVTTDSTRDYTVKVDVGGLKPHTFYYYQFEALGAQSDVGRTKTAAVAEADTLRFAVVSCSNFEAGYFNAYGRIAEKDLDAVLHLGDYIYEYGVGGYGDTTLGRLNEPPGELLTLSDYRTRYALYRLDKDLQAAHGRHPFITIWDDHEISNNAWQGGAQNHQPGEGDYEIRKRAAEQAYYEWLPVREGGPLYRKFAYGNLADLVMLDERLAGRTAPADSLTQPDFMDSTRTMLGFPQRDWLFDQLAHASGQWKIIGNQVLFSELSFEGVRKGRYKNLDAWDGYPYEQHRILQFLNENNMENVVFVSGDTHASWAFETPVHIEQYRRDSTAVAVEFGTTSISSPNSDEDYPLDSVLVAEKRFLRSNPHLKYVNLHDHGYLRLTLTPEKAVADWFYVETVKAPSKKEFIGKSMTVRAGTYRLE
ncbi:MAG: alkaline phosphatase [Bacteroidetes bacterium]|nr:MAG: alkaline phosphatase [Bacteroidota bacterium]